MAKPGTYKVSLTTAALQDGAAVIVEVGGQKLSSKPPKTGDWGSFRVCPAGRVEIQQPGVMLVTLHAADVTTWKAINLRQVQINPVAP